MVVILLCLASLARAEEAPVRGADAPERGRRSGRWDAGGEVRGRAEHLSPLAVDAEGSTVDAWTALRTRVLAGADVRLANERLRLVAEFEALNGQVAGASLELGSAASSVPFSPPRNGELTAVALPRQLRATWRGPQLQASAGLESFAFGSGLLANDGKNSETLWFGDAWTGSVMARARVSTTPWRSQEARPGLRGLGAFVVADEVVRDDNALWLRGDRARQVLGGMQYGTRRLRLAAWGGHRWQDDFDSLYGDRDTLGPGGDAFGQGLSTAGEGVTTRVVPLDAWLRAELTPLDGRQHVVVEAEVVHLRGTTTRVLNPETLGSPARLRSVGGLLRLRYDHDDWGLTGRLDTLYASGDNDPRDGVVRTFSFHSDFNVGMLLFDEVLPRLGARAADRLSDPALAASPSTGLRHAIPQGAFHNALAVAPAVRWRVAPPVDLRLGVVAARGAGDVVDLYQAAVENGGYNTTFAGGPPDDRGLGVEVDAGVHGRLNLGGVGQLSGGLEGALLVPGAALALPDLGRPTLLRARLDLTW
jgi:hypothetical protein